MFCENSRCQFHIYTEPTNVLTYRDRNDDDKAKEIKRLHVVQQSAGSGTPRDFYFCETCANVLAMTFGKTKTQTPKPNVSKEQIVEQEKP